MQIRFGEHSELVTSENPLPVYIVGGSGGGGEVTDGSITTEKFAEDAKAPLAGVADSANSVDWEDVSSKPATFTPSTHTHSANDITTGVLNVARIPSITTAMFAANAKVPLAGTADVASSVTWDNVGSKPATFTPSTHTHNASDINAGVLNTARIPSITTAMLAADTKSPFAGVSDSASAVAWTGITGKPTTFAASAHTHSISEVTGLQSAIDVKLTATKGVAQADSAATSFEELLVDFNSLLANLRNAGIIAE